MRAPQEFSSLGRSHFIERAFEDQARNQSFNERTDIKGVNNTVTVKITGFEYVGVVHTEKQPAY